MREYPCLPPESQKAVKAALALLEAGESEAMIFTRVDRASRCTEDFARRLRLSGEQGPGRGTPNLKTSARAPWHPVEGLHSMGLRSQDSSTNSRG